MPSPEYGGFSLVGSSDRNLNDISSPNHQSDARFSPILEETRQFLNHRDQCPNHETFLLVRTFPSEGDHGYNMENCNMPGRELMVISHKECGSHTLHQEKVPPCTSMDFGLHTGTLNINLVPKIVLLFQSLVFLILSLSRASEKDNQ